MQVLLRLAECVLLLVAVANVASAANITLFCKCGCPPNATILVVPKCASCTRQFCIDAGACVLPLPPPQPVVSSSSTSASTSSETTTTTATATTTTSPQSLTPPSSSVTSSLSSSTKDAISTHISTSEFISATSIFIQSTDTAFSFAKQSRTSQSQSQPSAHINTTLIPIIKRNDDTLPKPGPGGLPPDDNWKITCFQRGSYKDEFIIYSFLILVFSLLGWAAINAYMPLDEGLGGVRWHAMSFMKPQDGTEYVELMNSDTASMQ